MQSNLATWKAAVVIAATVLAAACGSGSGNGGTASHPPPAAGTGSARADSATCQDAAALRASLQNIQGYLAGKDSIASLRADLADANTKLAALKAKGDSAWGPQLAALETALKKLRTEATNPAVLARPAGVIQALADVRPKAQSFINAVKTQCAQL